MNAWAAIAKIIEQECERVSWKGWGMVFVPRSQADYLATATFT